MLNEDLKAHPDAVEKYFCVPLSKFIPKQLTSEQAKLLIAISMCDADKIDEFEEDFANVYWFYPAIAKRLRAYFGYTMDVKAQMLLCTWCESIGDMVIYLTYLQYWCKKNNVKEIAHTLLCEKVFPHGIFDRTFMSHVWDGQKVSSTISGGSDNLIDYSSAMQSILTPKN